jgi:CheY-like chemotaxis protein
MRYYLLVDGKAEGPFEVADLVSLPDFDGAATVCPFGATEADPWRRADEVPELAEAIQQRDAAALDAAPAAPEAAVADASTPETEAAPAEETAAETAPTLGEDGQPAAAADDNPARRLVLVADDDAEFRTLIAVAIKKEGFRVVTAEDGKDAVGKLEPFTPDILVTDLKMPRMGGLELIRALQSLGHSSVPVIVLDGTAIDPTTVSTMRLEARIVDFIKKPVSIASLLNLIHDTLGTKRLSPRQKAELENKDGWSTGL